jgi:hypothetical protein
MPPQLLQIKGTIAVLHHLGHHAVGQAHSIGFLCHSFKASEQANPQWLIPYQDQLLLRGRE